MPITDFTSYPEVRITLGLSTDELPDTDLALEMYANTLQLRLREVSLPDAEPGPGPLDTRFTTIKAIPEGTRTAAQQNLYNLTRLYSTYVVANAVAVALSTLTPKMESDGKRTLTRFSPESVYERTGTNIVKEMANLRLQIESISTTPAVRPYMTAVPPIYDPVTGV